ncbi:MAG: hypothetical protein OHK0013_18850 [Sandaracinaceae bacterium]
MRSWIERIGRAVRRAAAPSQWIVAWRAIVARWLREAAEEDAWVAGARMLAHDDRPHRWDDHHHSVRDGLALHHRDNGVSQALRDFARRGLDARADAPRVRG